MTSAAQNGLPRILFIEDDEAHVEIVRHLLEGRGIGLVTDARTADEGLCLFQQGAWDLVLVDYRLPGASGLEGLDRIREIDPSVPAIMLTAVGDEQTAAAAIKRGADEYLSKNDLTTTLPGTVRMLLKAKEGDERMMALLKKNQRDEELRKLVEEGQRLLRALPPNSEGFDEGLSLNDGHALASAFARLYRAVVGFRGGLPMAELADLRRAAGDRRLNSRQILELHLRAVEEILLDDDIDPRDLASTVNGALLLALLTLNDTPRTRSGRLSRPQVSTRVGPSSP